MYELLGYSGLVKLLIGGVVVGLIMAGAATTLVGGLRTVFDRGPTVIVNFADQSVQPYGKPKWSLFRWFVVFAGIFAGPAALGVVLLTLYQGGRWMVWWAVTKPWLLVIPLVAVQIVLVVRWLVKDSRKRAAADRQALAYREASAAMSPVTPPSAVVWSAPGRDEWTEHDGLRR